MHGDINKILSGLNDQEKELTLNILKDLQESGKSNLLEELWKQDYEEIPVSIDEFIENPYYIGKSFDNGEAIYPYWRNELRSIFKETGRYQEVALTGCLTAETLIQMTDNSLKSIFDIYNNFNNHETLFVKSYDLENDTYKKGKIINVFDNGIKDVYKIIFNDNTFVKATSNHQFLLNNKNWRSIDNCLSIGDSLFSDKLKIITDIEYVGKENTYDITIDKYHNFCLAINIVAHNSIGIGKSTIACIALSYIIYKLMCLKDPQSYYHLASGSNITIAFFNITLDLTDSVGFNTTQEILMNSDWFLERGKILGIVHKHYQPNKKIVFKAGSTTEHSLGQHIFSGMLDEVNFAKGSNQRMEQSKIMKTYNSVLARMGSRFMIEGKIAGMLFLVSSKKSEYDFIESYINKKKLKENVYVCDARLWDVKPSGTYSGNKFYVALGGSNLPSKIIGTEINDDIVLDYKSQGYNLLDVPIEFYDRFEMDIDVALMDIAGISVSHVTKFITYDNLIKCYNNSKNPFTSNIISIGMKDNLEIKDFFNPTVPEELYSKPLFIHIDTALTGDIEGLGCVARMGYKYLNKYDITQGEFISTKELMLRHVFSLGIKCPSGTELSFQKLRNFIYYLKYQLGWNIKVVSLDGYQSADCKQQLITMGFKDSTILSLDRTPDGYLSLKYAINEKRISLLSIKELELELINLERDNITGKIDHPIDGTKDMSDGLSGATYSASLYKDNSISEDTAVILEDVNDYSDNPQDILSSILNTELLNNNDNIIFETPDTINENIQKNPNLSLHEALNLYIDEISASEDNKSKLIQKEIKVEDKIRNKTDILNLAKKIKAITLSGQNNDINTEDYNNYEDTLIF